MSRIKDQPTGARAARHSRSSSLAMLFNAAAHVVDGMVGLWLMLGQCLIQAGS
jgi:hypothetical protein